MATLIMVEELAASAVRGRGGHVMRNLQWLHGFRRLGHDVVFLEFLGDAPQPELAAAVRHFQDVVENCWSPDCAALLRESDGKSLYGLSEEQLKSLAAEAAAVITLMPTFHPGVYPIIDRIRPRVIIESDPAYTHLWAAESSAIEIYGEHDLYYTVGANVGTSRSSLPTLGIEWRHLWNPIVLDWWTPTAPAPHDRFTTIGDWRGYGYLEFEGQILGPKAEEFRKFIDLPRRTGESMDLVLDIDPQDPDIALLEGHGWRVMRPETVGTPELFRAFVQGSAGEFSCAKGGYVGTRSGWFSDRSAAYLTAGRPVVVQATGFEDVLPTGRGLFAVRSVDEAAQAFEEIRSDYATHCAAARAIAVEYFDSDKVLQRLMTELEIDNSVPLMRSQ